MGFLMTGLHFTVLVLFGSQTEIVFLGPLKIEPFKF